MPIIPFDVSLREMVKNNPGLGVEMLEDAINALLSGNADEGRILLRQYINATIGFRKLGEITGKQDKNLMRTLGPNGNPTARNLLEIINACMQSGGLCVDARVSKTGHGAGKKPAVASVPTTTSPRVARTQTRTRTREKTPA